MSASAMGGTESVDRAALAGMLKGYGGDQLVEEVLSAWDELSTKNSEIASVKQRNRVLELDLAEREDIGAPEKARMLRLEEDVRDKEARNIHLERMLADAKAENESLSSSIDKNRIDGLEEDNARLGSLCEDQGGVIAEMEGKIDQLVDALEKAAEAGLTSITADEVRLLNKELEENHRRLESGDAEREALESERERLREMVEQVRGLLESRDLRIKEMESQMQRVMEGPRSISAEHDYLVEQIEELKRRLLERNREYEALRRRERRLHRDVFERDERITQMQLTMQDIEGGLTDRTAELKSLEDLHERSLAELDTLKRSERTREVVGSAFQDSLGVLRSHEQVKSRKDALGIEDDMSIPEPADIPQPGGTAPPTLVDIDDDPEG
jgi:chromosome segregation ATPase